MTDQITIADTAAEDAAYLRNLAALFRFFGNAFLVELTEEQIGILAQMDLGADGESQDEGYRWMRQYLAHRGDNARRDLAVDYARVFLAAGVFEGDTAVPYESVYLSEAKILMQEPRDEVVRIYRANGFAVNEELKVPEDHAGFELEFAALLCDRAAQIMDSGEPGAEVPLQTLVAFIDAHLLSWLPMLQERVDQYAETRFYPALVRIVIDVLREARAVAEEMLA